MYSPIEGRLGAARICILTIIQEEFDAAREVFQATEQLRHRLPQSTCYFVRPGSTSRYDIVLSMPHGRSNIPAGEAVKSFSEDFKPEFIFLVGTGGGIGKNAAQKKSIFQRIVRKVKDSQKITMPEGRDKTFLGDVVVADFVSYCEFRKLQHGESRPRFLPYDHPSYYLHRYYVLGAKLRDTWQRRITFERPTDGVPQAHVGNLVASEKFLGDNDNEYQRQVLTEYEKALVVEMESFGVARAIYASRNSVYYNPQYLVVRGISDIEGVGQDWKQYACYSAAALACEIAEDVLLTDTVLP